MLEQLADTPEVLPLLLEAETGRVCLIRLDEAGYRAASFLDERLLLEPHPRAWAAWSDFAARPPPPETACDFIFHMGHVGSTLLSRVLGERATTFSLREPAVLRTLARQSAGDGPRLPRLLAYLSRSFRPEQRALIKATSFVSEIGPEMMDLRPQASTIVMIVSPQVFLASIFAGPASREDAAASRALRLARLARRLGEPVGPLEPRSEGEAIAMGWLAEAMALAEIGRRFPERVLWLDFDSLLGRPVYWLAACLHRLDGTVDATEAERLARSPAFGRYSKGQEHPYDPGLRARLLSDASRDHAGEIERGLEWLNAMAATYASVADALRLIAAARRR